jgi:hypothetical protein
LNELFVLYPLIIPGWVSPVKPADIAHGGIPKALYDGQTKGLECLVDPWTELQMRSWTMAADDRVDLYCNGNLVPGAGQTVKPGEETLRQRLYLPHGNLMHGVNRLHYVVTRVGGDSEPSRDLLVLYHLRPADNLDLVIPPDVIANGVDAARAASGVDFGFTYANRRNHDRIEFLLGDIQVRFDVPDGTAPITHKLFTDTFQKVGDNPSAVAEFYVVDQLGNRTKSPEKRLDIHLAAVVPVPTLTNVRDANDKEIPNAGITTSTTVKLTGTASKGKEVEIYDGSGPSAVPKGKATADATTGLWELTITVPAGARRLYAKSLYHSGNVYSNVRTFTVKAAVEIGPQIYSIKDSSGVEIPNGTYTFDNKVTLKGTAAISRDVEIFANTSSKGIATATGGLWTKDVGGLTLERHSFKAVARYGDNQSTPPWEIIVTSKLEIDNSKLVLNGLAYKVAPWTPRNDFPGNTEVRHASGGNPPYKYKSADERIARVNDVGKVEGFAWGTTMISVEDASGQKNGYEVQVLNTYNLYLSPRPMTAAETDDWRRSQGAVNMNEPQSSLLWLMYSMGLTANVRTTTGANQFGDIQRTRSGTTTAGLATDRLLTFATPITK